MDKAEVLRALFVVSAFFWLRVKNCLRCDPLLLVVQAVFVVESVFAIALAVKVLPAVLAMPFRGCGG